MALRLQLWLSLFSPFLFSMQLQIVEYNIDKNGAGGDGSHETGIQAQIELLQRNIPYIDVLVLIEANQNCSASNHNDGPELFRQAFNLSNGAYAAEFKEEETHPCVTGNSILSKHPMELIGSYVYRSQCCLVGTRKGARNLLVVKIYPDSLHPKMGIYLIATHLEAGTDGIEGVRNGILVRSEQGAELANYAKKLTSQGNCVLIAGDFNSPDINLLSINDAVKFLKIAGLRDAHHSIPKSKTTIQELSWTKALRYLGLDAQLDYLFLGGGNCQFEAAQIIRDPDFEGVSDHYPIAAKLVL